MGYDFLVKQNKEYRKEYEEYQKILNAKREHLKEVNNETIKNMNLEELGHEQLKELLDVVGYNIDDELKEKLHQAYLFKKPYTNSVVEKMDFLNKEKKVALDSMLVRFKNKYMNYFFWSNVSLKQEVKDEIIEVLLKEGIIRKDYELKCPECRNYLAILREKEINSIKEFESLELQIKEFDVNDENREEFELLQEKYCDAEDVCDFLYRYCDRCGNESEFDNLKEMLKYCKEIYFIK